MWHWEREGGRERREKNKRESGLPPAAVGGKGRKKKNKM
jgi:hypothetical protein